MANQIQAYLYKKNRLTKRTKLLLNYLIGPILFFWLSWSIYEQIEHQTDFKTSWQIIVEAIIGPKNWMILLVFILMLINWGLEAQKWKIQVAGIQHISFPYAFKSVLAGQAMGFNTINRLGEPAARAAFLNDGNRIRGMALSIVGNMAQIIVTFALGSFAMYYMRWDILNDQRQIEGLSLFWLDILIYLISAGVFLFALAYFKLAGLINLFKKIPFINKYKYYFEKLEEFSLNQLIRLITLSFLRYCVFLLQYFLMLQVFEVAVFWLDAFALIGVMFLILGVIPTIALAELGIRGKLSLLLLGLVNANSIGIIATAAGIWFINLVLPAIAGTLFILGIQIFRKKQHDF